jgi:hypothetical protein
LRQHMLTVLTSARTWAVHRRQANAGRRHRALSVIS